MSHFEPVLPEENPENEEPKPAKAVLIEKRIRLIEVSEQTGLTTRQLARHANHGVPGVERATNGYHFVWWDRPETLRWIEEQSKRNKGQQKLKPRCKSRLSRTQLFVRSITDYENRIKERAEFVSESVSVTQVDLIVQSLERLRRTADDLILRVQWKTDYFGNRLPKSMRGLR